MYKVSDFDYNLPSELIAQKPIRPRDHSRLLTLNKKTGQLEHKHFYDILNYFKPGDVLILNNSRVFPARLIGHKMGTGGAVEIFLHRKLEGTRLGDVWECLVGGRVKVGTIVVFPNLRAEIIENNEDGTWQVKFNLRGSNFFKVINKIGEVPLPPYIKRNKRLVSDKNNYQTVFADKYKIGSAAAPTAGLHFTKKLLAKIKDRGVRIVYVTLHVGLGTFAPVKTAKIKDHKMHSEFAEISDRSVRLILEAKKSGGRIIAVGTTSCRALESADWRKSGQSFWTNIFIYPGYRFNIVDALITNFHLPKSTLIMLVSALAGKNKIDKAYQEAVKHKYRFFSYGDAMLIY